MNKEFKPIKRFTLPGNIKYYGTNDDVLIPCEYQEKKKETRGVWFSTVANIDIPKMASVNPEEVDKLKKYLLSVIDKLKEYNMNTVIFQVRPVNDALYESELNPWSSVLTGVEGMYPGFDPLGFFMENIKGKNINVHAWINPYRAGRVDIFEKGMTKEEFINTLDKKNFCARFPNETILSKQNKLLLDPASQVVRDFVSDTCLEIAKKYPVKAIHIDDYFYPYEDINDPDEESKCEKAGFSKISDFRRHNVDLLIKEIRDKLNTLPRKVEFGISPFAIHRTNSKLFSEADRNSEKAWDKGSNNAPGCLSCYAGLYADVYKWLCEGWIDYVVPQDYWDLDNTTLDEAGNEKCVVRYADIAKWWSDIAKETNKKIYIGHAIYRVKDDGGLWSNKEEIANQLRYNQGLDYIHGSIFFTYHDFTRTDSVVLDETRKSLKKLWAHDVLDI